MFLNPTVPMQTFLNLFLVLMVYFVLDSALVFGKAYGWLKMVAVVYWIGQTGLIIYNGIKFHDKSLWEWFTKFNDYNVLIPIYVLSILVSLGYLYGRGKQRKI